MSVDLNLLATIGASQREADYLPLLAQTNEGVAIFAAETGLQHWNVHFGEFLHLPAEALHAGATFHSLLARSALAGEIPEFSCHEAAAQGGRPSWRCELSGASGSVELRALWLDSGAFVVICHDLQPRRHVQTRLALAEQVFAHNPAGIVITDHNHFIRSVNPAFVAMTGFAADEMLGQPLPALAVEDMSEALAAIARSLSYRKSWNGEMAARSKRGGEVNASVTAIRVADADSAVAPHHVWLFSDISASKRSAEQVQHLAQHDPLTGLPNRLALQMRLAQALPEARRHGWQVALMFIDLDRFKIINDTLGHAAGDELLLEVASRLSRTVRESDLVARLGGDEFVILLPDVNSASDAAVVASKVLAAFSAPILVDGNELHTSPSIGIGMFPDDGADGSTLLRNADTAMYCAKAAGRNNYQFYASEMNAAATQRLDLERKLRHALLNREFSLAFQPQIHARSGLPTGVEALLRWNHPVDGFISPLRFIPIAEETGLIVQLGEWVLRTACWQLKEWLNAGLPPLSVAVNVSARQLRRRDFVETVAGVLAETDLPPDLLELEITESVAMENPEESINLLQSLQAMGVSIAIDDFGTGYSSLAYLKRLPIDYLKIDRSFVADIEHDLNDRAIAFGTIALAHSLGLAVIAEGVETEDQLELLRCNDCDEVQGYLFSPPLAPAAALAFLQQRFAGAAAHPESVLSKETT